MQRALRLLLIAAIVGAILVAGIPLCPTAFLLHVPCPGCGLTRASLRLLHGDVHGAIAFHPLVIAVVPLLAIYLGVSSVGYVRSGTWAVLEQRHARLCSGVATALLIAGIVVWIARFFGAFGGPVPV